MGDEVQEFRITAVRCPDWTDAEIQRRWKLVFDRILALDPPKGVQEVAPKKSEPKPPDTIPLGNDLLFEVDDDHLILRRGKAAIMINPGEVRALLDGLMDAAARLVSRGYRTDSDPSKTAVTESIPAEGVHKAKVDPFFSSVLDWLTKMRGMSDEELEALRQNAEVSFTKQQMKEFATAYILFREFGP
ncbi:MAG: hypothetical protein PVF47_10135 [Anaerolineae bacterium]